MTLAGGRKKAFVLSALKIFLDRLFFFLYNIKNRFVSHRVKEGEI